jgi:three-Cys-motif partner protein
VTRSPYAWEPGRTPPPIQSHSIAKHEILRAYITAYIQTLVSDPNRERFRLVLVDGFAGGGTYQHALTRDEVLGSPFIMLDAAREAEAIINLKRRKRVTLDIDFFFVEKDPNAAECLRRTLVHRGLASRFGRDIFLLPSRFETEADRIIEHIRRKMPKVPRAIFLLDQYGYSEVPTDRIAKIIESLPASEVILTFNVDALLNYFSDHSRVTRRLLEKVGVPDVLRGRSFDEIKKTDQDWRLFVQSCLYQELMEKCRAKYYTLFFIRSERGHGDYWLIHLSQAPRARDVMTQIHWDKNNYFVHYGGPGLEMFHALGYVSKIDDRHSPQQTLFQFDNDARRKSTDSLVEQIAPIVYRDPDGILFAELFATTCNLSPASSQIYRDAIGVLRDHKEIEVISATTGKRTQGRIQDGDRIRIASQRNLFATRQRKVSN